MQEKDGWERVRASVPDYRIIVRAERKARKARKYHKHHKIYIRGAHYEYLFEKVAGMRSIIYRRRLKHHKTITKRLINGKNLIIKIIALVMLLIIGICLYSGTINIENTVNDTKSIVNDTIENIIIKTENISLQTTLTEEDLRECENYIFIITNEKRVIHGAPKLVWDSNLATVAREHSSDMAKNNFFDHINLKGEDPTARAIKHGYNVHKELGGGWYSEGIAENIGEIPIGNVIGIGYVSHEPSSIATAHVQSWMESPGHKANILNIEYNRVGIGVAYDEKSNSYIATQDFW